MVRGPAQGILAEARLTAIPALYAVHATRTSSQRHSFSTSVNLEDHGYLITMCLIVQVRPTIFN